MKTLLQKLSSVKSSQWLLLILALSLLLWTFVSSSSKEEALFSPSQQEERIAALLSHIEGVGKCEVLIYYDEDVSSFGSPSPPRPRGALVISQGAANIGVQLKLRNALQTLLQLSGEAVEVFPMEE